MTDAPERIWAFKPDIFDNVSVWQDEPAPNEATTEYVRVDLLQEAEAERDRLRKAAMAVVVRWDSSDWKAPPTADVINNLRIAVRNEVGKK